MGEDTLLESPPSTTLTTLSTTLMASVRLRLSQRLRLRLILCSTTESMAPVSTVTLWFLLSTLFTPWLLSPGFTLSFLLSTLFTLWLLSPLSTLWLLLFLLSTLEWFLPMVTLWFPLSTLWLLLSLLSTLEWFQPMATLWFPLSTLLSLLSTPLWLVTLLSPPPTADMDTLTLESVRPSLTLSPRSLMVSPSPMLTLLVIPTMSATPATSPQAHTLAGSSAMSATVDTSTDKQ